MGYYKKSFPFQLLEENYVDVGETNAYSTCQVMICKIASKYYENALYLRSSDLVIQENLVRR